MSDFNNYPLSEWERVGVPVAQVEEWAELGFPLRLSELANDALGSRTPEEIGWWQEHGYHPANAIKHIRAGKTRDEVLADEWDPDEWSVGAPTESSTLWDHILETP